MNKSKRLSLNLIAVALAASLSGTALAHAEYDKPRFVAADGKDDGPCETVESACASIAYASAQANKGDVILLSQGSYNINEQSLFYLVSGIIPVKPGFNRDDNYKTQNIHINTTWLNQVPVKYAAQLRSQGFLVNTDQKGMSLENRERFKQALAQYEHLQQAQSDVTCVGGMAGQFSCENVDLLGHVPLNQLNSASEANDIWGFVDLNTHKEYALIGLRNGLSVVDVSVPESPIVVGSVTAQRTTWRDIKVVQRYDVQEKRYKSYAYLTADGASVGLMIIDLNSLPDSVSVLSIDSTDSSAHNAYIANVDYSTGVSYNGTAAQLHIAGVSAGGGAYKTFAIKDNGELNLDFAPTFNSNTGYTHDLSSNTIEDERVGSQCNGVGGKCTVTFDYSVNAIKLWNTTNSRSPSELSRINGNMLVDQTYIHSGWATEDGNVLFVHDELDERATGKKTTLQIFDISDLTNPQPLSIWTGPTTAIDHNGFVRGNRYYMSNYEKGLTILDISDPTNVTQVGMFDTYPLNNSSGFNGAWGVYPYLPSGNILVSDINSGLYIFRDKTVGQDNQDSIRLSDSYYTVDEGQSVSIAVERIGDVSKSESVRYETQVGSATDDDFEMTSGQLSWAAGDSEDKIITIQTTNDTNDDELHEGLSLRLYAPSGSLNLASPNRALVNINGIAVPYYAQLSLVTPQIQENVGSIEIPVYRGGDINQAFSVNYNTSGSTATEGIDYELVGDSVSWSAGDNSTKTIRINIINDEQFESDEEIILNLVQQHPSQRDSITLLLRDDDANLPPQLTVGDDLSVVGGDSFSLTATATDPEGFSLSYQWNQSAGTGVLISNDTSSIASAVAPNVAQTLTFTVTVTDDFGLTATDEIDVTVTVADTPDVPTPTTPTSSGGGGSFGFLSVMILSMLGLRRRKL